MRKKIFNFNKYKNIFVYDYITVDDSKFIDLINKCTFVVLPSCSEGISTSVLTCMLHGLIPVVTQESGIDVYDFGYTIESYRVEEIRKMLIELSETGELEINERSKKVLEYSRDRYTLANFTNKFRNIIQDINAKIITEENVDEVLDK
jgi:ABC-type antimicrobial peptide transport system ATPase subunit